MSMVVWIVLSVDLVFNLVRTVCTHGFLNGCHWSGGNFIKIKVEIHERCLPECLMMILEWCSGAHLT